MDGPGAEWIPAVPVHHRRTVAPARHGLVPALRVDAQSLGVRPRPAAVTPVSQVRECLARLLAG
ncbi:hypothetical protein [Mycobacterium riyadhense]|uniref:hypothetical protein n=1 Tax=Mycobacterium riyadhense TaxID=486698 RepID=UPI00195B5BFE|nr:hypothetical protein [Mycobacterium riyadhense]